MDRSEGELARLPHPGPSLAHGWARHFNVAASM